MTPNRSLEWARHAALLFFAARGTPHKSHVDCPPWGLPIDRTRPGAATRQVAQNPTFKQKSSELQLAGLQEFQGA